MVVTYCMVVKIVYPTFFRFYMRRIRTDLLTFIWQSVIYYNSYGFFFLPKGNNGTAEKSVANDQSKSVHRPIVSSGDNCLLFFDFHDAAGVLFNRMSVSRSIGYYYAFLYFFQIKHKLEVCFNEQNRNITNVMTVENTESECQLMFNVKNKNIYCPRSALLSITMI